MTQALGQLQIYLDVIGVVDYDTDDCSVIGIFPDQYMESMWVHYHDKLGIT